MGDEIGSLTPQQRPSAGQLHPRLSSYQDPNILAAKLSPPPPPLANLAIPTHSFDKHHTPRSNPHPMTQPAMTRKHRKRIVMNPPEAFIMAAQQVYDSQQQQAINAPMVVGPQGNVAMGNSDSNLNSNPSTNSNAPGSSSNGGSGMTNGGTGNVNGNAGQSSTGNANANSNSNMKALENNNGNNPQINQIALTPGSVLQVVSSQVPVQTQSSAITPSIASSALSATSIATTSSISTASTQTTSSASTSITTSSLTSSSSSSTSSLSSSSSATSSSPTSTASATSTSVPDDKPFTHSVPFIFLCLLGSLVIIAVLATSLSWLLRWKAVDGSTAWCGGACCCCRPSHEDDPDGLDDLVRSFENGGGGGGGGLSRNGTVSRASSMRRDGRMRMIGDSPYGLGLGMVDDPEQSLQRRSSLLAHDPGRSPFLHSGTALPNNNLDGVYGYSMGRGEAGSVMPPPPAHLWGGNGPLEVRNMHSGDMEDEDHGTPRETIAGSTPRFLTVDGNGLDTPWGHQVHLTPAPILYPDQSQDHPHEILSFPSPPSTISHEPQMTGNWASNLRNTLFAAIGGRTTSQISADYANDKFTRPVQPSYRGSIRRTQTSLTDMMEENPFGGRSFPIVEEEVDEKGFEGYGDEEKGSGSGGSRNSSTRSSFAPLRVNKKVARGSYD